MGSKQVGLGGGRGSCQWSPGEVSTENEANSGQTKQRERDKGKRERKEGGKESRERKRDRIMPR